jgi:hypothetical protein
MPADDVDFAHTGFQAIRKSDRLKLHQITSAMRACPRPQAPQLNSFRWTTRHEPAVAAERQSRTNARTINSRVLLMKNQATLKPIDETRVSGGLKVVSSRPLTAE